MVTKDGFDPDDSLPLFLSAGKPEHGFGKNRAVISLQEQAIGNDGAVNSIREQAIGNDGAVISLRFVLASILVATATATGISILSAGKPVTLFADVAASVADKSAPQPITDQSTPIIQSVAIPSTGNAEALPPTAQEVPTGEVNAPEPASQVRETAEASTETLFRKFQAWNAEQDAGALVNSQAKKENDDASKQDLFREFQAWKAEQDARDSAKPEQDEPARLSKNASASVRPMQKHRMARTIRSARAEMVRHVHRANVRRQNEQVRARNVQDARAQTPYGQYAEPPSFLESLNPFGPSSPLR
jgi:hypothetical protein